MQFKVGKVMYLHGSWADIKSSIYSLSSNLQRHCNGILILDTTNYINPHHFAYNFTRWKYISNKIYCFRVALPDLYSLQKIEKFVRHKKIEALLISSLSILFSRHNKEEIISILDNIVRKVQLLTKKYNLITLVGNSPDDDEGVMKAYNFLCKKENNIALM